MSITRETILDTLRAIRLPGSSSNLVEADIVRAISIEGGMVRFVLEVPQAEAVRYESVRKAAEEAVTRLPEVSNASVVLTAHATAQSGNAPSLKIGKHPSPQAGPVAIPGVNRIIAIASGKGGVGKSTVAANLAVALSRAGKSVGLLDADIHGPSQPRMMGVSERPKSPDGNTILPLRNHGVTIMSIGLMMKEDEAVVWRGPMLMGALQQMMGQVQWGQLDVLIVDLPPGTGDVQLTLSQKYILTGAIVVSTPQDVALLDARKAIDMFDKTKTRVLGLIENMSTYICPNCGHEEHIFGHGGVLEDALRFDLPFLGGIPLNIGVRTAGDSGTPVVIAAPKSKEALAFGSIARKIIDGGLV